MRCKGVQFPAVHLVVPPRYHVALRMARRNTTSNIEPATLPPLLGVSPVPAPVGEQDPDGHMIIRYRRFSPRIRNRGRLRCDQYTVVSKSAVVWTFIFTYT